VEEPVSDEEAALQDDIPTQEGIPAAAPARAAEETPPPVEERAPPTGSLPPTVLMGTGEEGKSRRRVIAIGAVGLGLLLTGAGALFMAARDGEGGRGGEELTPLAPVEEVATSDGGGGQEERVLLHIETVPSGAKILLDGEPVANPYDAEEPRSAKSRRVEATLEGYGPKTKIFILDEPQHIVLELDILAVEEPPPAKVRRRPPVVKRPAPPQPESPPTKTEPVADPEPAPVPPAETPTKEPSPPVKKGGGSPLKSVTF
jgi:hypothetical protein